MSIDYVQSVVNAVRERVECGRTELCQGPPTLPLCQYLLPGEQVPDIVSSFFSSLMMEKYTYMGVN